MHMGCTGIIKKRIVIIMFIVKILPSSTADINLILTNSMYWPIVTEIYRGHVGLGGLGVTYSPRDPRFAGSNPAEVDGFFQEVKILSTILPGGTLSWGPRV